jgi:hypothetical protein
MSVASGHCRPPATEERTRRALCSGLADAMRAGGKSLRALAVGAGNGQWVGWPPEGVVAARADEQRLTQALVGIFDSQQPYSCANLDVTQGWLRQRARAGEVPALRARLAQQAASAAR